MENISLYSTNIFLKLMFKDQNIYLYSNRDGMEYLNVQLQNSFLKDLFTPYKILQELVNQFCYYLPSNDYTDIVNTKWVSKCSFIESTEHEKIYQEFLLDLGQLVGKENIYLVSVSPTETDNMSIQNDTEILNFLEKVRLHKTLSEELSFNPKSSKHKL